MVGCLDGWQLGCLVGCLVGCVQTYVNVIFINWRNKTRFYLATLPVSRAVWMVFLTVFSMVALLVET